MALRCDVRFDPQCSSARFEWHTRKGCLAGWRSEGLVHYACKGAYDKNTCSCFKAGHKCNSRCHKGNKKCKNHDEFESMALCSRMLHSVQAASE